MPTVSTISETVNLLDREWVQTASRRLYQASDYRIDLIFRRSSAAADITGATPRFRIITSAGTILSVNGTVDDGAEGLAHIDLAGSAINFSGEYVGLIDLDGSISMEIALEIAPLSGVPLAPPATAIDWAQYSYANTAADGPVRAGTGLTASVNGDGSITLNVSAVPGATAWGNITGTLSAQTDLQSALDGKLGTTATAADVNPAGTSIAAALLGYVNLAGTQNITGNKLFSGTTEVQTSSSGATAVNNTRLAAYTAPYVPAAVAITGGTISGITDLAIADGGTGASTPASGRVALGTAQELILDPNSFQGPYNTGSNDDAGYVVGDLDTGTYRARGVGIATASATQQSKIYEMQMRVPENWTAFAAAANVFELQIWAGSTTSTDCKFDISIIGLSAIGASANTIYTAANQLVSAANVPQTLSVNLAGLASSTLPAMLIIRVTLYARNNLSAFIGGGVIRGQ